MNFRFMLGSIAVLTSIAGCTPSGGGGGPDMSIITNLSVKLDPPKTGFQLATTTMDVAAGDELQACYFYKVPDINNGGPVYIDKIEMAQNIGSHHLNVFRQNTVKGLKGPNADGTGLVSSIKNATSCTGPTWTKDPACQCFVSSNWSDWPIVANSQIPSVDANGKQSNYILQMPPKVAHLFRPGDMLMVQSHFVNATTQKTPNKALALTNFYQMADPSGVQEVGTIFATEQSISICRANPTPTFTGFCHVNTHNQPVTIFGANGHFHSRGTNFKIHTFDGMSTDPTAGTQFYESKVWDEPPMITNLNVPIPVGNVGDSGFSIPDGGVNIFGGISWTCTYQWAPSPACADGCSCLGDPTNCCYKFGPTVETSEHCNAFVYYYPKLGSTDIQCQ